jgi:hypothetical protein
MVESIRQVAAVVDVRSVVDMSAMVESIRQVAAVVDVRSVVDMSAMVESIRQVAAVVDVRSVVDMSAMVESIRQVAAVIDGPSETIESILARNDLDAYIDDALDVERRFVNLTKEAEDDPPQLAEWDVLSLTVRDSSGRVRRDLCLLAACALGAAIWMCDAAFNSELSPATALATATVFYQWLRGR